MSGPSFKSVLDQTQSFLAVAGTLVLVIGWLTYLAYQNQQNASDIQSLKASVAKTQAQESDVRHMEEWQTQHKQEVGKLQTELREFQALLVEQRTVLRTLQETLQEVRQDLRQLMQRFWKPGVWHPWEQPLALEPATL